MNISGEEVTEDVFRLVLIWFGEDEMFWSTDKLVFATCMYLKVTYTVLQTSCPSTYFVWSVGLEIGVGTGRGATQRKQGGVGSQRAVLEGIICTSGHR